MPVLFILLSAMFYITKHSIGRVKISFVLCCERDTENHSITEGENYFEEEERNIALSLASNLQDVVQKV